MLAEGWESRYHADPVTAGIPPISLDAMMRQRQRWAEGDYQHYLRVLPKVFGRLKPGQRLSYFNGAMNAVSRLAFASAFLIILPVSIISGAPLFRCDPVELAWVLAPNILFVRLARMAVFRLSGAESFLRTEQLSTCGSIAAVVGLFRVLCSPSRVRFWVSPKIRSGVNTKVGVYAITAWTLLGVNLAALSVTLSQVSWPLSGTLCTVSSVVTMAWLVQWIYCLVPFVHYWLVSPALREERDLDLNYREDSHLSPLLQWLLLPTNLAPLLTIVVCALMGLQSALVGHSICTDLWKHGVPLRMENNKK
jgi:hypothetical protein